MAKCCDKCKGTKTVKTMGGMSETCPECKGKGIIIEIEDVKGIKVTAEHIDPKPKKKKGGKSDD